jgi:Zn-dependent protease with chaperone function
MNFFEAQEKSYRNTRKLIALMTLGVAAVAASVTAVLTATLWLSAGAADFVGYLDWLSANRRLTIGTAIGTAGFIGFASLYRVVSLRHGGGKVARELGGAPVYPDDSDPLRRRLRNVVEEMAIASGVPTPEVFVLEHESGINAFAAGFDTEDAAIAVTRGALETLSRDELQGVIAHEFSHIFNGDMRLNIKLMGPMFGILIIGQLGRILLRGTRSSGARGSRRGSAGAALALGIGLSITGFVGLLFARLVKAGVSRQREYLADASAVQFTRQSSGIAGALKKIAGYTDHSTLRDSQAEEISHMLFASGFVSITGLLATHPPLLKRIQAIEPSFSADAFKTLHTEINQVESADEPGLATGFSYSSSETAVAVSVDSLLASIGNPQDDHYKAAYAFRRQLPADINDALESRYLVMLLAPALILHSSDEIRHKQLSLLEQQMGAERRNKVAELYDHLYALGDGISLPILNLALPLIKEHPVSRQEYLGELLQELALMDNKIELFEYALLRIYRSYIRRAAEPVSKRRWRSFDDPKIKSAAANLISIFAAKNYPSAETMADALARAAKLIPTEAAAGEMSDWVGQADEALDILQDCIPTDRQRIVAALMSMATGDGCITRPESELLRAFCEALDTPLPPLLGVSSS